MKYFFQERGGMTGKKKPKTKQKADVTMATSSTFARKSEDGINDKKEVIKPA